MSEESATSIFKRQTSNALRYFRFFGMRAKADLDDELRFHIEARVRDYMARGHTEAEARRLTAERLGDLAAARHTCEQIATKRDNRMRRTQLIDAFTQDVSFAFRTLGRQKTWAAVAIATLALGIGANTAIFSVISPLVLNPVPYPGANRVALIFLQPETNTSGMTITITVDGKLAENWRANSHSFEVLEPYSPSDITIKRAGEDPRVVPAAKILPSFATFAGVTPLRGRMFTQDEVPTGGVAVISEAMWRTQYGAREDIIGTTFSAFDRTQTIVGVMPNGFELPRTLEGDVDVWMPLDLKVPSVGVKIVGRVKPGMDLASAGKELDSLTARANPAPASTTKSTTASNRPAFTAAVTAPGDLLGFRDVLGILAAAVVAVVLIACANVAHLLLARGAARQREMAIRAALGAGAGRIFRQLATESVILSGAGALFGVVFGWFGLKALLALRPASLTVLDSARMDGTTLSITAALGVLTALAFGVIGFMQASRLSATAALKSGAAGASHTSGSSAQVRARGMLVVTEMALCTMLLVGATLLIRSLMFLTTRDVGFDPARLYSLRVQLPETRYPSRESRAALYRTMAERLKAMPGVQGVTIAGAAPLSGSFTVGGLQAEGQPDPPAGTTEFIHSNSVSADYFRLMGIRMVKGTTFTDTSAAAAQVVVNEAMAKQLWPGQNPLGKRMRVSYSGQGAWRTVTGVAGNVLNMGRTDRESAVMYTPGLGYSDVIIARLSGDAAAAVSAMTKLPRELDDRLALPAVQNVDDAMRRSVARPRFVMVLLVVFAVLAVGLAAVGLYGVLAYQVAQRTREIGIRVALGASRGAVARSVLIQGVGLAVIGAAIGLVAARGGTKIVSTMLYGVQATDALSFVLSAVALTAIAALACLVPMRRALAVDPLIAMRAD
jgi:putative ABC transport system permease protein